MKSRKTKNTNIPALKRLITVARRDTGQSSIVGRFLLGLYNGYDYPFNLNELRGLDENLFQDCIEVLIMNTEALCEIHEYILDGDSIFRDLSKQYPPEMMSNH